MKTNLLKTFTQHRLSHNTKIRHLRSTIQVLQEADINPTKLKGLFSISSPYHSHDVILVAWHADAMGMGMICG
jgi:hypothetical protein